MILFQAAIVAVCIAGSAALAPAAGGAQVHVRGTLSTVSGTMLTVATASGPVEVRIDSKTKVAGVVPASAGDITAGTYIGTANVPNHGTARALEVVVFPKAMTGAGEGDYPWDLPAGKHSSMMTNGLVGGRSGGSMMTNATVTRVNAGTTRVVTLHYRGGSKLVAIPAGIPIVRIIPGRQSMLTAGAHVVAFPAAGGAPAAFVVVGEAGAVPPM